MGLRRTHINLSAAQRGGVYQRLGIIEDCRQPERMQVTLGPPADGTLLKT
jgi:hypothetical protein